MAELKVKDVGRLSHAQMREFIDNVNRENERSGGGEPLRQYATILAAAVLQLLDPEEYGPREMRLIREKDQALERAERAESALAGFRRDMVTLEARTAGARTALDQLLVAIQATPR